MTTIVIMPGGFHPFHAGHYALYQSAQRAFPDADVYVAATDDVTTRPFPFQVKEKLAQLAGVDKGRFMRVKSPFKAEEITAPYNPARDTLIFVRSEKDSTKPPQPGGVKKDGSASYLQPLLGAKKLEPFARHAYMAYLPTVEFGPGMTSATQIRSAWPGLDERRKTALVMSLYPKTQTSPKLAATVVKLLDAAIGSQEVAEGNDDHIWGPQGNFAGDTNTSISAQVSFPKWQIGLPVFVKHLGQKGKIASLGNDSAIVDVGMRQYRVPLDGLKRYPSQGVAEGTPIVVALAPIDVRNPKKAPQPFRNQGDIVPPTKPPSTEKRGVKGRPGQRPMPDYTKDVDENQGWAATLESPTVGYIQEQDPDYIEEKWSAKYKSSINCANPKGFSQRAHCAGRKK
jgi:hypothetical protein